MRKRRKKVTKEQLEVVLLHLFDSDSASIVCDYLSWEFQMTLSIEDSVILNYPKCACCDPLDQYSKFFNCDHFIDDHVNRQTCVITRPLKLAITKNLSNLKSESYELYNLLSSSFPGNHYSKTLCLKKKNTIIYMTEHIDPYKNETKSISYVDYYP